MAYNPADYIQDFSWVGDIGKVVGNFASELPELLELNRTVHENNKFKDMTYSGLSQFVDEMDEPIISNIASSMGLKFDGDIASARQQVKDKIPKFSDTTDNKEYAANLVNQFVVPFVTAAKSKDGGGSLTDGDLMARIPGMFKESFGQTSTGKEVQSNIDLDAQKERTYGQGGTKELDQQFAQKTEQQQFDTNKQRGIDTGKEVQEILSRATDPEDIWSAPDFGDYSNEAKQQAYQVASNKAKQDMTSKLEDDKMQWQRDKEAKDNLPKIYDFTKLQDKLVDTNRTIGTLNEQLRKIKDKNSEEYVRAKQNIEDAKDMTRVYEGALKYLRKNPKATQEQVNVAQSVARANIDPEVEQQFINDWKSGQFEEKDMGAVNPFNWGKQDDINRLKKSYRERFGVEPKIEQVKDAKGKTSYDIVPQFGSVQDVESTVSSITTPPQAKDENTATINALKALIEQKKKQGK